ESAGSLSNLPDWAYHSFAISNCVGELLDSILEAPEGPAPLESAIQIDRLCESRLVKRFAVAWNDLAKLARGHTYGFDLIFRKDRRRGNRAASFCQRYSEEAFHARE